MINKKVSRKKYTSKSILDNLISMTKENLIIWKYLSSSFIDDNLHTIFFSAKSIHDTKYLVFELNVYDDPALNTLKTYIQSTKTDLKIPIREFYYSRRIKDLSILVIENTYQFNDEEDYDDVYAYLKGIYEFIKY